MGIKRVRPLAGGFFGWREKGYPLAEWYPPAA
jgi:3-mercaptopyruvate sulfurtransferase SseA